MDNKQISETALRRRIRELIEGELNEITTTGNVAGYLTPGAFVGDKHGMHDHIKKIAKRIGYTLTKRGSEETGPGDTLGSDVRKKFNSVKENIESLTENYYQYKNDPSSKPHQKIGRAISEIHKQLKLVERALKINARLKTEAGVSTDKLWKRTHRQIMKLEQKFVELSGQLRNLRN